MLERALKTSWCLKSTTLTPDTVRNTYGFGRDPSSGSFYLENVWNRQSRWHGSYSECREERRHHAGCRRDGVGKRPTQRRADGDRALAMLGHGAGQDVNDDAGICSRNTGTKHSRGFSPGQQIRSAVQNMWLSLQ